MGLIPIMSAESLDLKLRLQCDEQLFISIKIVEIILRIKNVCQEKNCSYS